MVGKVVFAEQDIDSVNLRSPRENGVHARDISEDLTPAAVDVRLTACQVRKSFEDAKIGTREPNGKPRACRRFFLDAGSNVLQHLHDSVLLTVTGFNLDKKGLSALCALFSQHLHSKMEAMRLIGRWSGYFAARLGHGALPE